MVILNQAISGRPGYGLSEACPDAYDERTNANALVELVSKIFGKDKYIILGGHDRGARAMQRLAVDMGQGAHPEVHGLGVFLADIVPIVDEYDSFANPNSSVGYFHWAFLPRVQDQFSLRMIMAFGGGNMADFLNEQGAGINATAKAQFYSDNALAVYHTFFDQLSVTNASVWDYWSAAGPDYLDMVADQKAGRKIKMPLHVEYSQLNMVTYSGFDMKAIWGNYVDDMSLLTTQAVCCGQGHFIVELAPDETVAQLNEFMDKLGVVRI
ncbi:hypothetical protein AMS68_003268 [Peltaster fructicola]|uniref:AB hydrolase-1 domain-containing protein n=1 Tax=Peltaster fructicola TaxID=286661 RepID=A0A6H0XSW2_9PEZI|nr:hypothetical protein AMS68_003268 [Peltaster fructicola]